MKKFDKVKTIQLIIYIALAAFTLYIALTDAELKNAIALNFHVQTICTILWAFLIISFCFLFYDFGTYSNLKREYSEMDLAIFNDPFTGIANRYSCDIFIEKYLDKPLPKDLGCITIDLTNLGEINQTLGHREGNNAIRVFSNMLSGCSINVCFVGRNGGNKFLAIFTETTEEKMDDFLKSVDLKVQKYNSSSGNAVIHYSYGKAFNEGDDITKITELIALSNKRSYEAGKVNEI